MPSSEETRTLTKKRQHLLLLTWKPRFPKRDRAHVLSLVQQIYPTATADERGVTIPVTGRDTRAIWLFLLWKCWRGMEKEVK